MKAKAKPVKRYAVRAPVRKKARTEYRRVQFLVFTLLVLVGGYFFVKIRLPKPAPVQVAEVGTASSAVVELKLSPETVTISKGQPVSVNVEMNSNGAAVTAAVVEMTYDPAVLGNVTVTQGDFLPVKLSAAKVNDGKISFIYAAPPESRGKDGSGKVATLDFTPIQSSPTSISFTGNSIVAAMGFESNMLKRGLGASLSPAQVTGADTPVPPVLNSNGADADPLATLASPAPEKTNNGKKPAAVRPSPAAKADNKPEGETPSRSMQNVNFGATRQGTSLSNQPTEEELLETAPSANSSFVAKFVQWINSLFKGKEE